MLKAVNDMVFKFIFGSEERKELLREFVNLVLSRVNLPLASTMTLRNPFNLRQFETDKESILDIGAADESGRMFDIEVQLSTQKSYGSRALYYWSRVYGAQLPEAGKYEALHPVIGIHIVDFVLHERKRHFIKLYRPVDVLDPDRDAASVLSEDEVAIILELPLMPGKDNCGRLEKLLLLLENEGGNEAMTSSLAEQDRIFAEIDEAFRKFTADPELMYIYEGRRKAQLDKNSMISDARKDGIAEGKAEGKAEGIIEVAHRFKALGVAVNTIAEATGLSAEEIASI
ncbi:MAG: Rpn family recombination-promoting nuclease/putative transposase [Spirochaetota bacterium]